EGEELGVRVGGGGVWMEMGKGERVVVEARVGRGGVRGVEMEGVRGGWRRGKWIGGVSEWKGGGDGGSGVGGGVGEG
ncbi:hypothetical protein, partial [Kocuria rhizophila]|uniref:hypothetical protein n=1 Tax=Kocuria rhizophila TaxID=72000 RepID=UPI001C92D42E